MTVDEIKEIIDGVYDVDHNGSSFVDNWDTVAQAIHESHQKEIIKIKEWFEFALGAVQKEVDNAKKDRFCGVPMDSLEVDQKLEQYGYIKRSELQPILDGIKFCLSNLEVIMKDDQELKLKEILGVWSVIHSLRAIKTLVERRSHENR